MAKKKRVTAKKACKHLKLDSKLKIPLCGIEPIICRNWFCDAKGFRTRKVSCNLECFRKCAIKNPDASIVSDLADIYSKTINKIDERLNHHREHIPENELIGGFLAYRELEVLRGFYATPGAFTDVFGITELIPEDISFLNEKDISISNDCRFFLALLAKKTAISMELNQMINGDLIVYCTLDGLNELEQTMKDPENDDLLKLVKQGKDSIPELAKKGECHHIMQFDPLKNYKIIEWCKTNQFQREILKFSNLSLVKRIRKHFSDITMTGRGDARECYDLSYRPYMNAIYALRNIYSHSKRFLRVAKKHKDLWTRTEKYVQWLPIWDNSIMMFGERERKKDYLMEKIDIEDNPEYPMHIGKKTFFPSMVMWTFVGKNWDDICSSRWIKGPIFETMVEQELVDRNVNIIDKNIQLTPDDEVDFLCEKDGTYYMIEAKNYGPNWDYNFLSSLTYDHRMVEMNSRIALAPRRLALINNDRKKFSIPQNAKLQGVIVTSFIEPHINVLDGFVCLSIDRFNRIFGKKVILPDWKKRPGLQLPEDIVKEMHRKVGMKH